MAKTSSINSSHAFPLFPTPSTISHKYFNLIKQLTLPILIIAGPLIALFGMLFALILNFIHCRHSKLLYDKKIHEKATLEKDFNKYRRVMTEDEQEQLNNLDTELANLEAAVKKDKKQLTQEHKQWVLRMIPCFFAAEVMRNLYCKTTTPSSAY